MDYDIVILKKLISQYMNGEMSAKDLGKWAKRAYFDLLRGGYIEKRKIVIYPFLKTLSKLNIECDDIKDEYPCSEDEIRKINNIMCGKNNCNFQIEMAIPAQLQGMFGEKEFWENERRIFLGKMREQVDEYLKNKQYNVGRMRNDMQKNIMLCSPKKDETILEYLENTIIKMYQALFEVDEPCLKAKPILSLYIVEKTQNLGIYKLKNYLDCYFGERNLCILVSYEDGIPEISLLV